MCESSSSGRLGWIAAIGVIALLLGLGGGTASGENDPASLSRRPGTPDLPDDFLLGLEASQQIARYYGLVETDSLVQRVNEIGYAVALTSGQPGTLYTFQILNMPEPNAMALPGGWIFVTRGILDVGLSDAELAHLLGHEVSHVSHADFSRQGRLNGLLSLLQTAVTIAVSMTAARASPNSGPVIADPDSDPYPQTSARAALSGAAVFGSVFQELLLRGYSRKLEMEADEGGRRLAALAGYPREAGASLLAKLHDRIYEDREFGYWRTHPYFTDRIGVARAAAMGSDYGPSREEVAAYRLNVHQGLASAAASFRDERLADFLYELALRAGPESGTSLSIHADLLQFRLDRLGRRNPMLRAYGPLEDDCDSLLARGRTRGIPPALLARISALRDSIEAARLALLPPYIEALRKEAASTVILEHFLLNFPDRPEAPAMRLRLARAYRLSSRPDLAAEKLADLLGGAPAGAHERESPSSDSSYAALARAELLRTLPRVQNPDICQRLSTGLDDQDLREAASARLQTIADTLSVLDTAGRFVQSYPNSPSAALFRNRLASLADSEFKKGRLHEGLGDRQSALAAYNRVAILAPETPAATESRRGIARIQAVAASGGINN